MLIKGWNNSNKACLNISFLGSILKDVKTRAITDTSEAYPEIMMINSSKPNDYRYNYNKNKNFKKNFNKNQHSSNKKENKKKKKNFNKSNGNDYNNGSSRNNSINFADFNNYSDDEYYLEVVGQKSVPDGKREEIFHLENYSNRSQMLVSLLILVQPLM